MRIHDVFFYGSLFFLTGIFLSSIGWKGEILILSGTLILSALTIRLLQKKTRKNSYPFVSLALISILVSCLPAGALYHTARALKAENISIPFHKIITFQGKIASNPAQKTRQEFKLQLLPPYKGNIQIQTTTYPEYQFGEILMFTGKMNPTKGGYGSYLEKTKDIRGTVYFPKLESRAQAPTFGNRLFSIKKRALNAFKQTLPYTESAFLGGTTLGEREEFSEDFKEAMAKSGTTHLVALSGYNVTIITNQLAGALAYVISRKRALWATILLVIAFVLMTGAESSVVRAAVMGVIAAIAPFVSRIYAPRNAIIVAALAMALWNPAVLAHDLGFQLSFLALLGIVYLTPALTKLFNIKNKGFLNWKENGIMTLSAQLSVAPLLLSTFGSVSATSLLSNILILELIPTTMALGAILAATHLISQTLATLTAWLTLIPLKTELAIIELFAHLELPISAAISLTGATLYYALLAGIIWRLTKFKPASLA